MVKREFVKPVMNVRRVIPKISFVDLVLNGKAVTVISVYRPQSDKSKGDTNSFYDDLSTKMQSKHGNCTLLGAFSGRAGSSIDEYKGVRGE